MPRSRRSATVAGWRELFARGYERLVVPSPGGLPNWRVVIWFPIMAAVVSTVLIILGISGTSSGAHWANLGSGADPRLLEGVPRGIRSDEWLVQQGWVVSQALRGFPAVNEMFPGGTDMTVLNELPSWDWSSLFRPHLWGYLFFGLNIGMAWHWWVPAFVLVSSCYLLLVTLLPRRPLTAALLSIALLLTPFLQWWYTPSTVFAVAWPLFAMAGVVWVLVDPRVWVRMLWCAGIGYLAVTLAMGLYVPFIIPGLFVFLAFSIGYLFRVRPWSEGGARALLSRMGPLLAAGTAAVAVTAIWALTRLPTFIAIASTVYPGQRSEPTGGALLKDPFLIGIGGAPWNQTLKATSGVTALGLNSSEGSSVILLSLFVLPGLAWFLLRALATKGQVDWLLVTCLLCFGVVVAYLLVPGWDTLAHLMQFDRVPPERFRIAFVVFLPVFAALVVEQVDRLPLSRNWAVGVVCGALAGVVMLALWSRIKTIDPTVLGLASTWKIIAVLIVCGTALLFVRRGVLAAAAMILVASALMGWGINPLYRGVFDLSKTTTGEAIQRLDDSKPGTWVGVGSFETMALLVESDTSSFSGVQIYPSEEMWEQIDPASRYEDLWNRLGHVQWSFGPGEPTVVNPQPDVISVTIDPCSEFAQKHISYVLTDTDSGAGSSCLRERFAAPQGNLNMHIFEIVSPSV